MKLLVLDVEGTLFRTTVRLPGTRIDSTIWQACAHALGPDAVLAEIRTHERWHAGEYSSYLEWMKDTIAIHLRYGLTQDVFHNLIGSAQYHTGVEETLRSIDRSLYEIVLVSGGFRELVRRAQIDLNIHHGFAACEYFFDQRGNLGGFNLLPCDFAGKIDFIQLMLREYGLTQNDWIFVGDGLNDVPVVRAAPMSVAFGSPPELRRVATFAIDSFFELGPILASHDSVLVPPRP